MALPMDRRSVLSTLAALPLAGCGAAPSPAAGETVQAPAVAEIDLRELEGRSGGRLGLALHDLASGRRLVWRAQERFVYCSTFKAYLAAATLLRVQTGDERLDRAIPITAADMINHAPVTEAAVGSSLTVEQLMKATVEVSDNPAANLLLKALGGLGAMQQFYRSIGDQTTRVDRFEPEMNRLDGDKDTIQPLPAAANLHRVSVLPATPLSAASKALLLRWMTDSPTGAGRIKAGVPAGWTVAHKTGTGGYGPTNDIGVLYPPTGEPVVLAIYYHATPETSAAANDAVIAEATRSALKAVGHG